MRISDWSSDVCSSDLIGQSGLAYDQAALEQLISLVRYVDGDYKKPDTFLRLKQALGKARRPTHYLAIPPSLFGTVIKSLEASGLARSARVIVEKPFGRDLASARELNRLACSVFPEEAIFRIAHFLGKEAIIDREERRVGKERDSTCRSR